MSTNINVGLLDGRNSSRVSKPPGGGHTQLFGNFEAENPKPKNKQQNNSEINACFTQQDFEPTKPKELIYKKEDKEENSENDAPEPEQQVENKAAPPQRIRVPPGGFSSGFW